MQNFMLNLLKKKKRRFCRSSPDPENSRCGHQQPYNFFSVFADFRTAQENQNCLVQCRRISCNWGKKFFIISKEKIFRADWKESLLVNRCLQHYFGDHGDSYISSPLFYFSFAIIQSEPASIAWTVTSTAAFYHCWKYTEHSGLWIRCVVYIWY